MNRPAHLPDYERPPLNEVVLGIQFSPPSGYQHIYAKDVWELYQANFPKVEEKHSLEPSFEIFGRPQTPRLGFQLLDRAPHNRYWFISNNDEELIQFQHDRLLHNWRKVGDKTNPYPRFESMIENFENEINTFNSYLFSQFSVERLIINQCEVSYINHIPLLDDTGSTADDWVNLFSFENFNQEDISFVVRQPIPDKNNPRGRLICECNTAIDDKGRTILILTLTVKGAPSADTAESALEFIKEGRERIVMGFDSITTSFAHEQWGRK